MGMGYSIVAMGINSSIISSILLLLGVVAVGLSLLRLLYAGIDRFYKWLSQRQFFVEFLQRRERRRREAQKRDAQKKRGPLFKRHPMSRWEFLAEIFAEPVILTVAVVLSYDHFKGIWDTSPDFATFWFRINENTRGNMFVAVFLTIAIVLWMIVVVSRRVREDQRDREYDELQSANTDKVVAAIEKLAREIRKSKNDGNTE